MKIAMEHTNMDTVIAFLLGLLGGMMKIMLDAPLLLDSYFLALIKAGATAFVCGLLGVAGKYFFNMVKTKFTNKK